MDTAKPEDTGTQQETVAIGGVSARSKPSRKGGPKRGGNRARSLFSAAAATLGWNLAVVAAPLLLLIVLAWWLTERMAEVDTVIATAGTIWIAGHGAPVVIDELPISLTPLLLTLVIAWRLSRVGAHTIRAIGGRDAAAVRAVVLATSLLYIAVFAAVVAYSNREPFTIEILPALAYAVPLAILSLWWGAANESGVLHEGWMRASLWLRRGLRTGSLAAIALIACGAAVAGVSVAVNGGSVGESLTGYENGEWAVGLLCLLYLPNIAIWSATYIIGPGFAVGDGTIVQVTDVTLNPLPPLPWFAALPAEPLHEYGTALLGLPLVIGALLGILLTYRSPDLRLPRVITAALIAALTTGALIAVLSWAASGSTGTGLLAQLGPHPWHAAGIVTAEMALAVLAAALVARLFAVHRRAEEAEAVRRDTVVIPSPADSPEQR
ncbi:DUF6350 family protein [Natronoglycomyces albus]|uniref:Uncharacterized protein n=1 Tax=Natronoglycomyces albus TaxID=2811108 RepID=A0A895XQF5_9ACTN|nr:DUF6350 family protein [Natronoglycomyces albus]QSB04786.1 hypothetical protein JQS30_13590 [Natronoglycomyces albus]